ncbi:unnamed protein product [Phytophthora fragariaefolia]|uniref:Unnamed protein product n=1 Tax=Phytophthora fragariaefolia TaxID=1490495 RepID=A0A9W7CYI3_9STRA|nr:unnamed protein product [Phytophthora fragariaefolia]
MDIFKMLKLKMESLNDDILSLQGASTIDEYANIVSKIEKHHPTGISEIVEDMPVDVHVWIYLKNLHPTD